MSYNAREYLTAEQQAILGRLEARTRANPITGADIAMEIGFRPQRAAYVRSMINALRAKGFPVCGSGKGYWWPSDREELTEYIAGLEARAAEQQKAIDGLKRGYDKITFSVKAKVEADSRAGIYIIRRANTEPEPAYCMVAADQVDAFLAANPTAVKYQ